MHEPAQSFFFFLETGDYLELFLCQFGIILRHHLSRSVDDLFGLRPLFFHGCKFFPYALDLRCYLDAFGIHRSIDLIQPRNKPLVVQRGDNLVDLAG